MTAPGAHDVITPVRTEEIIVKSAASKATVLRRAAGAGVAVAALLGTTGCWAINEQSTALQYAPSDGIVEQVGEVELLNLLLVSQEPSTEGRYLGSIHNQSAQDLEVVITIAGTSTTFPVAAGERLELRETENENLIPDTGSYPGGLTNATVEVAGVSEELQVPVLDGTLPEYRPYVPGGVQEGTTDHLYQTPEPAH